MVDIAMGLLLRDGRVLEPIVLAAVWLVAAVLVLARVPQGAWRRTPMMFAGIAIAHPVTRSLGLGWDQSPFLVVVAVMAVAYVIFMVPMDWCLARLDTRRSA